MNPATNRANQSILTLLKTKLFEVLQSIKDISLSIAEASTNLVPSQLISGGASQASSSQEISAAMEQISEVIKQSAENANETAVLQEMHSMEFKLGQNMLSQLWQ